LTIAFDTSNLADSILILKMKEER